MDDVRRKDMLLMLARVKGFHTLQDTKVLREEAEKQYKSGHDEEVQEVLLQSYKISWARAVLCDRQYFEILIYFCEMFLSSNIQTTWNGAHVACDTQTLTGHILWAPE